jgi:CRISPR/Cas system-associated endonuclease Cas1
MEPLRPQVDRLVLTFLTEHVFHPKDFIRQPDGACRLHPQLARVAAQLGVSQDMVQSVVDQFGDRLRRAVDATQPGGAVSSRA